MSQNWPAKVADSSWPGRCTRVPVNGGFEKIKKKKNVWNCRVTSFDSPRGPFLLLLYHPPLTHPPPPIHRLPSLPLTTAQAGRHTLAPARLLARSSSVRLLEWMMESCALPSNCGCHGNPAENCCICVSMGRNEID